MFKKTSNMEWAAVRHISQDYAATLQRLTPEIYSEMEGIAEGSGLDTLDIVALNCRSEIALGMFSDGCTSLGWRRSDGVLLAQNWDWTARVKENLAIMSIDQPGKPKIFMVNEVRLQYLETRKFADLLCRPGWLVRLVSILRPSAFA